MSGRPSSARVGWIRGKQRMDRAEGWADEGKKRKKGKRKGWRGERGRVIHGWIDDG